jgi:hypothetical protein
MYTAKHNFLVCYYVVLGNMFRLTLSHLQALSETQILINSGMWDPNMHFKS